MFVFGIVARDVITGFVGTIVGHCSYISGCDQYLLAPKIGADGKFADSRWFDENRIEPVEGESIIVLPYVADPGRSPSRNIPNRPSPATAGPGG